MKDKAAISNGKGLFVVDEFDLGTAQAGKVCGRVKASGICHTDFNQMSHQNRTYNMRHKGAGVIEFASASSTSKKGIASC